MIFKIVNLLFILIFSILIASDDESKFERRALLQEYDNTVAICVSRFKSDFNPLLRVRQFFQKAKSVLRNNPKNYIPITTQEDGSSTEQSGPCWYGITTQEEAKEFVQLCGMGICYLG
jgi:hypothetical protein